MSGSRWLIVAVTVAWLVPPVAYTVTGQEPGTSVGNPLLVVVIALAVGALHVWHAMSCLRGGPSPGWPVSLALLMVLVYLPLQWWSWSWVSTQCFGVASLALLLRPRPKLWLPIAAGLLIAPALIDAVRLGPLFGMLSAAYDLAALTVAAGSLYGSVLLVQVVEELRETRPALAAAAVSEERLRLSRDLHDLLGQSLSAVSLKGDLALALFDQDRLMARAEVAGMAEVARDALRDIRAITRGEHSVSLRSELDGAAVLLDTAGIQTDITADLPADLGSPEERLLAWAVREGVTNLLRHSRARTCAITIAPRAGTVELTIVNDGASAGRGRGSGLAGLADRARALSGTVTASHDGEHFRLGVSIPHAPDRKTR
ncbi:sensor histidine kinase [Actinoallomurus sp. CA-142502]|uniref:sensor histidine kinase n=1 Tax=Actinoallomurus sp. CA-142502 TaxID=3239885 RepID=UPI003D8C1D20